MWYSEGLWEELLGTSFRARDAAQLLQCFPSVRPQHHTKPGDGIHPLPQHLGKSEKDQVKVILSHTPSARPTQAL